MSRPEALAPRVQKRIKLDGDRKGGLVAVCLRKRSGKRQHAGRKYLSTRGETGGMKTTAGTATTGEQTRSPRSTPIPKAFRVTAPGTRAATSWSGVPSGTTKPIPQTSPPVKKLSARNGAAAGDIPTNSPSAHRSAHSWFPKRSTISGDFGLCCRCSNRAHKGRKYGRESNRFTILS